MKKSTLKFLSMTAAITGVVAGIVLVKEKRKREIFSRIQENCLRQGNGILDDQGSAPKFTENDCVIMNEQENCIAKKALYDLIYDSPDELDCDIDTLIQYVKNNCKECRGKKNHGCDIRSK